MHGDTGSNMSSPPRFAAAPRWSSHATAVVVSVGVLLTAMACGGGRRPAMPASRPAPTTASADALCEAGEARLQEQAYTAAAQSLDQCIAADPTRAYAYYHAGIAYQRIGRVDLMANRFEMFVKLAPEAPERPEVEAILRTLR
jgi:Tfp pilus assembly protein PilF